MTEDDCNMAREYNARTAVLVFELIRIFRDRPHYDKDEVCFCGMLKKSMNDIQNLDAEVVLRLYELLRMHLDVEKLLAHSSVDWGTIDKLARRKSND